MLAISVALLIQALFFGDGGVTAYGANCFNMAIGGSLVAYGVYRLLAGQSPLTATRRVIAAGLVGILRSMPRPFWLVLNLVFSRSLLPMRLARRSMHLIQCTLPFRP